MIIPEALNYFEIIINLIYTKYLSNTYCLTIISDNNLNFHMITGSFVYLKPNSSDFENLLLSASNRGCADYIAQVSEPMKFLDEFASMTKKSLQRKNDRKLIFLPVEPRVPGELLSAMNHKETAFLPNLVLVVPHPEDDECFSYDIVAQQYKGPIEDAKKIIILDKWNSCTGSFTDDANLFPNDMSNVEGKTVRISSFNYEPYVLLHLDKSIESSARDGIEIKLVDEFCRYINCTIEMVAENNEEAWGEIFENGTGTGVLGKVLSDEADIAISALYSWFDSWKVLDFSAAHVRTAITCLAPAPKILIGYDLPLKPFRWDMWATLFGTFVFSALAFYLVRSSADKVLLNTFGIMITQVFINDTWRLRSITIWLLITAFVIDNAYGSGLAAAFTVPEYEESIDTVQDLIDVDMEWGQNHPAWVWSLTLSQEPQIKKLVGLFRVLDEQTLAQRSTTRDMAFGIEKLPAGQLAVGRFLTRKSVAGLQLMLQDFYWEQSVTMMRKGSPYINKMTDLVGILHQSGLLLAWETQVALKYLDYQVQLEVRLSRSSRENEVAAFTFQHVMGAFIIYTIGLASAIIMFALEWVTYKNHKQKHGNNLI